MHDLCIFLALLYGKGILKNLIIISFLDFDEFELIRK